MIFCVAINFLYYLVHAVKLCQSEETLKNCRAAAAQPDSITLASSFSWTGQKGTFCSTISCYTMSKCSFVDIIILMETRRDNKLQPHRYLKVNRLAGATRTHWLVIQKYQDSECKIPVTAAAWLACRGRCRLGMLRVGRVMSRRIMFHTQRSDFAKTAPQQTAASSRLCRAALPLLKNTSTIFCTIVLLHNIFQKLFSAVFV